MIVDGTIQQRSSCNAGRGPDGSVVPKSRFRGCVVIVLSQVRAARLCGGICSATGSTHEKYVPGIAVPLRAVSSAGSHATPPVARLLISELVAVRFVVVLGHSTSGASDAGYSVPQSSTSPSHRNSCSRASRCRCTIRRRAPAALQPPRSYPGLHPLVALALG